MSTRHWGTNTQTFLRAHLQVSPNDHLRIATGFFTIAGQEALRDGFNTTAWILVGFEENAPESEAENITRLIQEELETNHNLTYEVIRRLADDLQERIRVVQTRYRRGDHAKVIIFGSRAVFLGSANLTLGGMRRNAESLHHETSADEVAGWIAAFDQRWHDRERTRDVTAALRALLLEWLRFAQPFDTYLAACHAILDTRVPIRTRDDYLEPLPFQSVVAKRAAASIGRDKERGHWIIASTGLGKTIMATHVALLLFERRVIREVIVIAPARTLAEWKRQMRSAQLNAAVFSTSVVRRDPNADSQVKSRHLQAELKVAGPQTLLVIDESHEFRNRYTDRNGETIARTFVERLDAAVEKQGVRVLLLTATPYAKSLQGINNQLMLLPHAGDGEGTLKLHQKHPHSIQAIEQIYEVPVVTAISYNTVRNQFAQTDDSGTYVVYRDGNRGYIQALQTQKVAFTPLAAEPALKNLPVFVHTPHYRTDPESQQRTLDGSSVMRQLIESLTSSPADLKRFLTEEVASPSNVAYRHSVKSRTKAIQEILKQLEGDIAARDEKLTKLLALLKDARKANEKVLVFVGRKETGRYLKGNLLGAGYRTEFLYGGNQNGDAIIAGFAPHANKCSPRIGKPLDVLIATDTIAAGVNLQDATIVIHYDLPWTADIFNQRNGRITRFRDQPASIRAILFTATENLQKLNILEDRLANAEIFTNIDRIESAVGAEIEGEILSAEGEKRSSEVLVDFATLAQHQARAAALRFGLLTARYAAVKHITTVTVLRVAGVADAVSIRKVHQPSSKKAHVITDSEALHAFRCTIDDPIAAVSFQTVDALCKKSIMEYVERSGLSDSTVQHVATVVLIPLEHPKHLFNFEGDGA